MSDYDNPMDLRVGEDVELLTAVSSSPQIYRVVELNPRHYDEGSIRLNGPIAEGCDSYDYVINSYSTMYGVQWRRVAAVTVPAMPAVGANCRRCKEFNPWAQGDGREMNNKPSYVCRGCRHDGWANWGDK